MRQQTQRYLSINVMTNVGALKALGAVTVSLVVGYTMREGYSAFVSNAVMLLNIVYRVYNRFPPL